MRRKSSGNPIHQHICKCHMGYKGRFFRCCYRFTKFLLVNRPLSIFRRFVYKLEKGLTGVVQFVLGARLKDPAPTCT